MGPAVSAAKGGGSTATMLGQYEDRLLREGTRWRISARRQVLTGNDTGFDVNINRFERIPRPPDLPAPRPRQVRPEPERRRSEVSGRRRSRRCGREVYVGTASSASSWSISESSRRMISERIPAPRRAHLRRRS